MSTVLQQLLAEYEASTQGEWEVFARQGLNPGEEEWFLGYEITGPEQPSRGQFVRRADAALCVAAHNKMPLLLAALEAAAELQRAEAELKSGSLDIADWTPFNYVRVHARHKRARIAFEAAIASLLKEIE